MRRGAVGFIPVAGVVDALLLRAYPLREYFAAWNKTSDDA
jgi:hypothetical protein